MTGSTREPSAASKSESGRKTAIFMASAYPELKDGEGGVRVKNPGRPCWRAPLDASLRTACYFAASRPLDGAED